MFDVLITHIQEKVDINADQIELLKSFFTQKKLSRKEFLLKEGEICKNLAFVSKGILKSYILDERGNERINLFAFEGWWISDFNSFLHQEKAFLNIDAIEESELLLLSRDNYEELTLKIPIMDRYALIASYLGLSPETVSRIRKKISHQ